MEVMKFRFCFVFVSIPLCSHFLDRCLGHCCIGLCYIIHEFIVVPLCAAGALSLSLSLPGFAAVVKVDK